MSLLVSSVVTKARGLMHDRKDSNYVREFLNEQATGAQLTFQTRNRHLLQEADGAPMDVDCLVAGTAAIITNLEEDPGLLTLQTAPTAGQTVEVRYYFEFATDEEWLDYYRTAAGFVGDASVITALTDTVGFTSQLEPAVTQYAAAQASRSLASLTHWYYSANAGNKSFNKDQISKKLMEQAAAFEAQAEKLRLSYYNSFDANQAPAFAYTGPSRGTQYWEPKR